MNNAILNTEFVYGYTGLCELLDCSKATAWRLLKTGIINRAVSQAGRKIVINKQMALDLLRRK